ncbi:MAG: hypothetical protein AAF975_07905 [Spirochaetota bacterium]
MSIYKLMALLLATGLVIFSCEAPDNFGESGELNAAKAQTGTPGTPTKPTVTDFGGATTYEAGTKTRVYAGKGGLRVSWTGTANNEHGYQVERDINYSLNGVNYYGTKTTDVVCSPLRNDLFGRSSEGIACFADFPVYPGTYKARVRGLGNADAVDGPKGLGAIPSTEWSDWSEKVSVTDKNAPDVSDKFF